MSNSYLRTLDCRIQDSFGLIRSLESLHFGQHSPGGWYWFLLVHCNTGQALLAHTNFPPLQRQLIHRSSGVTSTSSEAIWPFTVHSRNVFQTDFNVKIYFNLFLLTRAGWTTFSGFRWQWICTRCITFQIRDCDNSSFASVHCARILSILPFSVTGSVGTIVTATLDIVD